MMEANVNMQSSVRIVYFLFTILIITVMKGSLAEDLDEAPNTNSASSPLWPARPTQTQNSLVDSQAPTVIREQNTVYRARVNETVKLPCVIENRRQASVIWQYSKERIPETIYVSHFYYRRDYRIRVIINSSDEQVQSWNLEIRRVRLEDEGYYLCKVMAEPKSLKRAVYLKVEVDLTLKPGNTHFAFGDEVSLICNTSYHIPVDLVNTTVDHERDKASVRRRSVASPALPLAKNSRTSQHHQPSHMHIVWHKDGQRLHNLAANNHNLKTLDSNLVVGLNNLSLASQLLDFKIEHHTRPVLWSRLVLRALKPTDMGVYTCSFRSQNVSTLLTLSNLTNKRYLESDSLLNVSPNQHLTQSIAHFAIIILLNLLIVST